MNISFEEALSHCRWKKELNKFIPKINISLYKGRSFEYIFQSIYYILKKNHQAIVSLLPYHS